METIIKTENMKKVYNPYSSNSKTALKDISISIEKGQFVCVMGTSGSGKTTLINVLSTIDSPTSGQVFIFGKNILLLSEKERAEMRKNKIGFIFQDNNLIDALTIIDNILFSLRVSNSKIDDHQIEIDKIIDSLGIRDILDKYPFECSGGQQQRAAIARVLIRKPKIIFADEPTGNIDSIRAKQLMEYLVKINQELGITIIMVTHDCLVASYASEMYYIEDGMVSNHIIKGEDSLEKFYNRVAKISMQIDL